MYNCFSQNLYHRSDLWILYINYKVPYIYIAIAGDVCDKGNLIAITVIAHMRDEI